MKCWAAVLLHQMIRIAAVKWWKLLWSHRWQWFFEWIVHIVHLVFTSRTDWWTGPLRWRWFRSTAEKAKTYLILKSNPFFFSLPSVGCHFNFFFADGSITKSRSQIGSNFALTLNSLRPDSMHILADRRGICVWHLRHSQNDLHLANDPHFDYFSIEVHRCKRIFLVAPPLLSGTVAMDSHNLVDSHRCCSHWSRCVVRVTVTSSVAIPMWRATMNLYCFDLAANAIHSIAVPSIRVTWPTNFYW